MVTENAQTVEIPTGETVDVNGKSIEGPAIVYRNAELRGVAICPYGTDKNTDVMVLKLNTEKGKLMTEEEKKELECSEEVAEYSAVPELENYIAEFGLEKGVEYYRKGVSFDEAKEADYQELKKLRLSAEEEKKPEASPETSPESSTESTTENPEEKKEPLKLKLLVNEINGLKKSIESLKLSLKNSEAEPVSGGVIRTKTQDNIHFQMAQHNSAKVRKA